jgi:hypothetical protein
VSERRQERGDEHQVVLPLLVGCTTSPLRTVTTALLGLRVNHSR